MPESKAHSRTDHAARVRPCDDFANARLVEAFVAVVALEDFHVGADRAFVAKMIALFGRDQTLAEQAFASLGIDRPNFALCECLLQMWKIGERSHGFDAFSGELIARRVEIELRFKVVHPGL